MDVGFIFARDANPSPFKVIDYSPSLSGSSSPARPRDDGTLLAYLN